MKCVTCDKDLPEKSRKKKFCDLKCKNTFSNNKYNSYESQKSRAISRKKELVKLLGGECIRCGYSKNMAALCFHHLTDKSFSLDSRKLSNSTWESAVEEASKCVLLCHNCHMEEHHPHFNT